MDLIKIAVVEKIFLESEVQNLMMTLSFYKDSGVFVQMSEEDFAGYKNFYFLVNNPDLNVDRIERAFKLYNVKEFSTRKLMGEIK